MRLDIFVDSELLPPDARDYLGQRLRLALGIYGAELRRVRVQVRDENEGPQGPLLRCTLRASGPLVGALTLDEVDASFTRAVDRLADRMARTMARTLESKRIMRQPPRRMRA
ncbi:MAG: hypothetical protein KA712_05690 [Myxococcales bacterium]|nr:hypothetical protein [Myxococcales bacterium]